MDQSIKQGSNIDHPSIINFPAFTKKQLYRNRSFELVIQNIFPPPSIREHKLMSRRYIQRQESNSNIYLYTSKRDSTLEKHIRHRSVYGNIFGMRPQKQINHADLATEFSMHRKERMAMLIIQNIKNAKQTSHKCIKTPMLQKMKDFKKYQNQNDLILQTQASITIVEEQTPEPFKQPQKKCHFRVRTECGQTASLRGSPKNSSQGSSNKIFLSRESSNRQLESVSSHQTIERLQLFKHKKCLSSQSINIDPVLKNATKSSKFKTQMFPPITKQ